jgi:hypothetical protein
MLIVRNVTGCGDIALHNATAQQAQGRCGVKGAVVSGAVVSGFASCDLLDQSPIKNQIHWTHS